MKYSHKTRKRLRKAKRRLREQEGMYMTTRGVNNFKRFTGFDLMPEIFDAVLKKKNVRLLDIGAGSNQLIRDIERKLKKYDAKEGGRLAERFRGVGLSLTDLSLPSIYRYALSGKEGDLKDAYSHYLQSDHPGDTLSFKEFRAEMKKPESKSLGFARSYIRGDIEKAFEKARLPKFDFVTSLFALRYVPDILYVLEGIHNRLMAKNGKAILDLTSGGFGAWGKTGKYSTLEMLVKELEKKSKSVFEIHKNPHQANHFILLIEKKEDKIKFPFKLVDVKVEMERTIAQGTVKRQYKETGRRRKKKS